MSDPAQQPDDFAAAFARLQVRVETACVAEAEWPDQVAAGIGAALRFAAAEPASADLLTNGALASGPEGHARYERILDHFAQRLRPGRALRPDGERLPGITEKAMVGGLAMLVAQRLDRGRAAELPGATAEAIQFVLTPYLGTEQARRVAAESGA
jgi:hypothetical protein